MKGDPRRQTTFDPGARRVEFPGLGWGQRVGTLAPPGVSMKDIGAGSQVWAQRCQAWVGTSQGPTYHMSKDCCCKSGRVAAEGSTVCPWQTHLEWGQMAPLSGRPVPSQPILHHRALLWSQVNALSYYLWLQKGPLSWQTLKWGPFSLGPWRPLSTGIMKLKIGAGGTLFPMHKDSTGYCLFGLKNQWQGK